MNNSTMNNFWDNKNTLLPKVGAATIIMSVIIVAESSADVIRATEWIVSATIITLMSGQLIIRPIKKIISMLKRHSHIEKLAYQDSLTGLRNRAFLVDAAKNILSNPKKSGLFVFVDLDNFKQINDTHGHNFGDVYLKDTAQTLLQTSNSAKKSKDEQCLVARLGGDEFAIIFTGKWKPERSKKFLQKLNGAVDGVNGNGKASVGAARYPDDANNLSELMKLADGAMYTAKRGGKNPYYLYGFPT